MSDTFGGGDQVTQISQELASAMSSVSPTTRQILHTALEGLHDNLSVGGYDGGEGLGTDELTRAISGALQLVPQSTPGSVTGSRLDHFDNTRE